MNEHERYFFDLNGYLVIEDALTLEETTACNEAIDHEFGLVRERLESESLAGGSRVLKGRQGRGDLGGMLTWSKPWCQPFRTCWRYSATASGSTTYTVSSCGKAQKGLSFTAAA